METSGWKQLDHGKVLVAQALYPTLAQTEAAVLRNRVPNDCAVCANCS